MTNMNTEIKKIVSRVKEAQEQLQSLVKSQDWVEEARRYAERQGKEVKKLFAPDVEKMKVFLEKERKELERFQKQIPGEVKKLRKFVDLQKKEFEKLLANVRKMNVNGGKTSSAGKKTKAKTTKKPKTAAKKKSTVATTAKTPSSASTSSSSSTPSA